jgi:3-oxoadipate enol-lactonase
VKRTKYCGTRGNGACHAPYKNGETVKSIAVNGTEMWCVDRGAGLPLLLVHGFPLDHTMWAGQIDALAVEASSPASDPARNIMLGEAFMSAKKQTKGSAMPTSSPSIRIIAPDLPGFGRSPSRKGDEKVTMEQFADDLAGLLDGLDVHEPVVLCGLSMGGYIALQFWRKYAARLRGLILCDTRAAADTPEAAAARLVMADRVLREGPVPLVEGMLPKVLAETTLRQQPQVVKSVQGVMMTSDPHGIAAAARGMAERPDMTASLSQIRCPTLVIVGQNDVTSTPAEMRGIAEAIPKATFVEIPAAGHLSPLENPTAVNAAMLWFLQNV